MQEITITKQLSKQGDNSILIIPKVLREQLRPRDLVSVNIKLIKRNDKGGDKND